MYAGVPCTRRTCSGAAVIVRTDAHVFRAHAERVICALHDASVKSESPARLARSAVRE